MGVRSATLRDPAVRDHVARTLAAVAAQARDGRVAPGAAYVLPHPPREAAYARDLVRALVGQDLPARGVRAIAVDLYDVALAHLDAEGLWEEVCAAEAEGAASRDELVAMLEDVVSVRDVLAPAVEQAVARARDEGGCDLAFVTGVGETFPYVRTHALMGTVDLDVPLVLVFPGTYRHNADGSTSLDVLDIRAASNGGYYRATSVFDL